MDETTSQQLCVACNRVQSSNQTSCECGHVMREALTLRKENSRKRRAPFRPNSVSSEWIVVSEDSDNYSSTKKMRPEGSPFKDQNNNYSSGNNNGTNNNGYHGNSKRTYKKQGRKKIKPVNNSTMSSTSSSSSSLKNYVSLQQHRQQQQHQHHQQQQQQQQQQQLHQENHGNGIEKQNKIKELFDLIENSYQNAYFNRCKSYKKAKLSDLDFEFDFSTFDSRNPFYPSALEDINSKINRTNSFWNSVSKMSSSR